MSGLGRKSTSCALLLLVLASAPGCSGSHDGACRDALDQATSAQTAATLYGQTRDPTGVAQTLAQVQDALQRDQRRAGSPTASAIQRVGFNVAAVYDDARAGQGVASDAADLDVSVRSLRSACAGQS